MSEEEKLADILYDYHDRMSEAGHIPIKSAKEIRLMQITDEVMDKIYQLINN
jgi:hypothetical protein